MATPESPLQKRIRERADELKTVLSGRALDLKKIRSGIDMLKEADISDPLVDRLVTAMQEAVDVVLKAVENPPATTVKK